jgi:hypothetical protein
MTPPRRTPYTFYLDPDHRVALEAIKKRTGDTVSTQVRRGIELWLRKNGVRASAVDPTRHGRGVARASTTRSRRQ